MRNPGGIAPPLEPAAAAARSFGPEALHVQIVAGVIERIREAIVHCGLTAADLGLGGTRPKTLKALAASAAPKSQGKATAKKPAGTIKFTDGQGKTWNGNGIGKMPQDILAKPDT